MKTVELRNAQKKKKPHFRNHNSHKIKRATDSYRKPRGIQNKMRLHHRGYSRVIGAGFRSPAEARGLTRDGLMPVLVHHVNDLAGLEAGKHGVVLGSGLGQKKKLILAEEAAKLKLTLVNANATQLKTAVDADMKERKEKRAALSKKRQETAKKAQAKPKEEKKKEEAKDKLAEKKELDKVLTQKK